jgi:tight adherence protein C
MSDLDLLPILGAAAIAAVLAWLAVRAVVASVPEGDRRWRERPPGAWRLAFPLASPLAALIAPILPPRWQAGASRALRQAGLDGALDAAHVFATSLLGAVLSGAALVAVAWAVPDGVLPWRASTTAARTGAESGGLSPIAVAVAAAIGAWLPLSSLRERRSARLRAVGRALPFYLDVITLSVESGANLTGALQHAVAKGPPGPLRLELERVLRDVRAGRTRAESLRAMADRLDLPSVASWVAALLAAERHGSGLGPILRAQAEQRRTERFQQAEKLAMKAPVKMLFPLLVFIFPCTFVLLFFPVAVRLLQEGLLR